MLKELGVVIVCFLFLTPYSKVSVFLTTVIATPPPKYSIDFCSPEMFSLHPIAAAQTKSHLVFRSLQCNSKAEHRWR